MKRPIGKLPPSQRTPVYRHGSVRFSLDGGKTFSPVKTTVLEAARELLLEELTRYMPPPLDLGLDYGAGMIFGGGSFSNVLPTAAPVTVESIKEGIRQLLETSPTQEYARAARRVAEYRERIRLAHYLEGLVWLEWWHVIGFGVWLEWWHVIGFGFDPADDVFARCQPSMRIVERHTGQPGRLSGPIIEVKRNEPIIDVAKRVRDAVKSLLEHELDEQLFVDGERAFDPHRDEGFTFRYGGTANEKDRT